MGEFLEKRIEILRCDLLDIEIKLGDALRTAFGAFETRLKTVTVGMKEKTNAFIEETLEEATDFALKIKNHGLDLHDQLKNQFELLPDDKQEEESETKTAEYGEKLFSFLLYETREDIMQQLDAVGDHINANIGARESKIVRELQGDF